MYSRYEFYNLLTQAQGSFNFDFDRRSQGSAKKLALDVARECKVYLGGQEYTQDPIVEVLVELNRMTTKGLLHVMDHMHIVTLMEKAWEHYEKEMKKKEIAELRPSQIA